MSNNNKTMEAFNDYKKALYKTDIPQAKNVKETTSTDYLSKHLSRWKNKAYLVKAEQSLKFYQKLSDNIGVFARKDALEIKKKVDKWVEASTKNIPTKLTEVFKTLKEAKDKLKAVRISADELHNNLTDSVFADDVSTLSKKFKDTTPNNPKDNERHFGDAILGLKTAATQCFDLSDDVVEVAVKVSGIHATTNVLSLADPTKKVADSVAALQTTIGANMVLSQTNTQAARDKYTLAMESLAEAQYARFAATLNYAGILDMVSEVCQQDECKDEHPRDKIAEQLDTYATKVEDNFDKVIHILAATPAAGKKERGEGN